MVKKLKIIRKNIKVIKYLLTTLNVFMILILILLIYMISTPGFGEVSTTIDLTNLKVYKISVTDGNSNLELFCNIGIAITTGFLVSYNLSKYSEFQEKKFF